MDTENIKPLNAEQKKLLTDKINGFGFILTEAMRHVNVCLYMNHWANYPELTEDELHMIYFSHYKLAVIDAAKLISFKRTDSIEKPRGKSDNDIHAIYSIFHAVDNLKSANKSSYLMNEMTELKKELSNWDEFSEDVLKLRNEWFAHFGKESRREKTEFIRADYLNNYLVLLNEFIKLLNAEFSLGFSELMDEDHEFFVRIYRKVFGPTDNFPFGN